MSGHQYKKFGNVVYSYNGEEFLTRQRARKRAKELRQIGFLVRVQIDRNGMYAIYTRRKER